jgi:AcrR family transcriptional regulator
MEPIPARLMRAQVAACKNRPAPTPRESARRAYIIEAARNIFIAHGRLRVTLKDVAIATGLTQISIRNQIADLDHLFAITLTKHLDDILTAIAAVPSHHQDLFARRRAEYLRVTRGLFNIPTPMHFLLMRERFTLPEDELEPLEARRRTLGFMLAGAAWETALLLLDSHHLDAPAIERMLQAQAAAPEALPEPIEDPAPLLNLVAAKDTPPPQASASYDTTLRKTPASFFRVVNTPQVNNSA